jgi:hypothetical protein
MSDDFCVEEMMKETTELFPTHLDSALFRRFRTQFDDEHYLIKHKDKGGEVYILLKVVGTFIVSPFKENKE